MRAGELDRRIRVERAAPVQDDYGQPLPTNPTDPTGPPAAGAWSLLVETSASRRPARGTETFAAQQRLAVADVEFQIRYPVGLEQTAQFPKTADTVLDLRTNERFDVLELREIGRREGLVLGCRLRAGAQA